jgi:hypothetical protein
MRLWLDRALLCIDQLDDTQVWYRPNPQSNAVGNLVLHLVGNLKQWILGGISDLPDTRNRPAEFSAPSGQTREQLRSLLKETVEECCRVIDKMPVSRVTERKRIQGEDVTIAAALVMAISHLGLHVGQMQYIGKMLLGSAYQESWKLKEERMSKKLIMYVHVLKNVTYPICNADPKGYYFDGKNRDCPDEVTHLMACYGPARSNKKTAHFIRKIDWHKRMSGREILASGNGGMINLFKVQLVQWPHDATREAIHVFQLGEKIPIPPFEQNFEGGDRGYIDFD